MTGSTTHVDTLLERATLPANAAERVDIARADDTQRMLVASLYAVPAARYEDPALVFRAEVVAAPWDRDG